MDRKDLIEAVVEQIREDLDSGDVSALWELLEHQVHDDALLAYLPEEK